MDRTTILSDSCRGECRTFKRWGKLFCFLSITSIAFGQNAVSWQDVSLSSPAAKIIDQYPFGPGEWSFGLGAHYVVFDGASGLDDAPAAEISLSRQFPSHHGMTLRLALSYLETNLSRTRNRVTFVEPPVSEDPPTELPPGPVRLVTPYRESSTGRIWRLDLLAEQPVVGFDVATARIELVVRGGVGASYLDFDHDEALGPAVRGGVSVRLVGKGPWSLEAGVDGRFTHSNLEGVDSFGSSSVFARGSVAF